MHKRGRRIGYGLLAVLASALIAISTLGPASAEPEPLSDPPACGSAEMPECPLQAWMKGNATPAMIDSDFARLERIFKRIAAMEPSGYAGWSDSAMRGAEAAHNHDLAACRTACGTCHDAHRERYRREMRGRKLP